MVARHSGQAETWRAQSEAAGADRRPVAQAVAAGGQGGIRRQRQAHRAHGIVGRGALGLRRGRRPIRHVRQRRVHGLGVVLQAPQTLQRGQGHCVRHRRIAWDQAQRALRGHPLLPQPGGARCDEHGCTRRGPTQQHGMQDRLLPAALRVAREPAPHRIHQRRPALVRPLQVQPEHGGAIARPAEPVHRVHGVPVRPGVVRRGCVLARCHPAAGQVPMEIQA